MSYQNFIARLQKLHDTKQYPPALLARIKKEDIETILLAIINDAKLEALIEQATPVSALRLSKDVTGLARDICLLRTPTGEYQCVLETENRDADNNICAVEEFDGLIKKGTTAWRLDCTEGPTQYASLQIKFSNNKELKLHTKSFKQALALRQKEIDFTWSLPENDYLLRSVMGAPFSNKNGSFISIYAPYGIRLDDLDTKMPLTQELQNQVVSAILETLTFLEKNNLIHQDIKSANLLVFIDTNKKVTVKLIDFDAIYDPKNKEFQHALYATVGYESPEIALVMADPSMSAHQEYEAVYKEDGKTLAKKWADNLTLTSPSQVCMLKKQSYLKPDHKNDVWACAIAIHEFLHNGIAPLAQPESPLLKGMLEPEREQRFTATKAQEIWQAHLQNQQATNIGKAIDLSSPAKTYVPQFKALQEIGLSSNLEKLANIIGFSSYLDKLVEAASDVADRAKRWIRRSNSGF